MLRVRLFARRASFVMLLLGTASFHQTVLANSLISVSTSEKASLVTITVADRCVGCKDPIDDFTLDDDTPPTAS